MYSEEQVKKIAQNTEIDIEKLVDKDDHKRFLDGDINLEEKTGFTKTYGKWSLSSTHLLIVIGVAIDNGASLEGGDILSKIDIPTWILDKIYPLFGNNIDRKPFDCYADDLSNQPMNVYLRKSGSQLLIVTSAFTATANRNVRIAFDLLIDNE